MPRSFAAFAILLWFAATFFLLGNTGKHSDDYTVVLRDRATGAINLANHPWHKWPFFWRPLHLAHASVINTISWKHLWIGHLELAIVHGVVALLLGRFLVRLGVRPAVARGAGLLFMVCPMLAEAVLWTTASCNAISAVFMLLTLELVRREAVRPSPRRAAGIFLLAFVTACWYEPAAAALGVTPLLYLAVARPIRARVLVRTTLAAGLGCALYVGLLVATAPGGARGGAESFAPAHGIAARLVVLVRQSIETIGGRFGRDVLKGSIENGWHAASTWWGILLGVLLVGLGAMCVFWRPWIEPAHEPEPSTDISPLRRGGALAIGAGVFGLALLPVAAVESSPIEFRTLYIPLIGVAIAGAGLASGAAGGLFRLGGAGRIAARIALALTLASALAGACGMIGFQAAFRTNWEQDCRTIRQLGELVPDAPQGTLFLTLRVDATDARTGHACFDHAVHDAFQVNWCCRAALQEGLHRRDVGASPLPGYLRRLTSTGAKYCGLPTPIAWERCVPFIQGVDGSVRLVRRLTIVPAEGSPFVVEFPRVPAAHADDSATLRLREVQPGTAAAHAVLEAGG